MVSRSEGKRIQLYAQAGCVLLLGGILRSAAQVTSPPIGASPQSGTATLHVSSRLVVLDVVVLDKAGRPVRDLDRSQFSITEDKIPQKLRDFDPPAGHTMPQGKQGLPVVHSAADLAKIGNAPVNILVFDELNTKWEGTVYARTQMENYLKAQPEVLPVPTLLLATGDSRFIVLHDYTQSRADLLEAVHKHFPQYPWQMMRGGSNSNIDLLEQTLGALSQIAESSRGTPGRKNVIWVGSGYPSLGMTTLQTEDEDKLMTVVRLVTDRMMRARITLYMVDPIGVQTGTGSTGTGGEDDGAMETGIANVVGPYKGRLDFSTFATSTGGEVFSNRNDINVAIGQGIQDGGVYYTLSYVPSSPGTEAQEYRKIRVAVRDPSLRVFTREGYFSGEIPPDAVPSAAEKPPNQLHFDIVSAARTRLVYNGLKVSAARTDEGYSLLVGAKDLHWIDESDESRIAEVTVMTVFFNARDKELQSKTMELKERTKKSDPLTGNTAIALQLPMSVPQRTARVRFVVRDAATGLLGTADATR